jgi:hypothetical protein
MVASTDTHRCVECHRPFPQSKVAAFSGFYACVQCKPQVIDKIRRGEPVGSLFRDGNKLVMLKDAVLPDRCARCNAPAEGFRATFRFLPMKIEVGLCPAHRKRHRNWTFAGSGLQLAGFACLWASGTPTIGAPPTYGIGFVGVLLGFLISLATRTVRRARQTKTHLFLKGFHPDYLAGLPNWPGS